MLVLIESLFAVRGNSAASFAHSRRFPKSNRWSFGFVPWSQFDVRSAFVYCDDTNLRYVFEEKREKLSR